MSLTAIVSVKFRNCNFLFYKVRGARLVCSGQCTVVMVVYSVQCTVDHRTPGSHGEQLHSNRDTSTVTQRPGPHEERHQEVTAQSGTLSDIQ